MTLKISLSDGTANVELPPDMQWRDEFAWDAVEQTAEYSLTGALIVQEGVKQAGREITLYGGDDSCWVRRSTVEALYALASVAGQILTLTYHDRTFPVMFRRPGPIEAAEIRRVANPGPDDWYSITIKLMTVAVETDDDNE